MPTDSTEEDSSGGEAPAEKDAEPNALLRFVEGHPIPEVTTTFCGGVVSDSMNEAPTSGPLSKDQASWHLSPEVQDWIQGATGG